MRQSVLLGLALLAVAAACCGLGALAARWGHRQFGSFPCLTSLLSLPGLAFAAGWLLVIFGACLGLVALLLFIP